MQTYIGLAARLAIETAPPRLWSSCHSLCVEPFRQVPSDRNHLQVLWDGRDPQMSHGSDMMRTRQHPRRPSATKPIIWPKDIAWPHRQHIQPAQAPNTTSIRHLSSYTMDVQPVSRRCSSTHGHRYPKRSHPKLRGSSQTVPPKP
jgi:hypothetical protein